MTRLLWLLLTLAAAACAPTFDWRESGVADGIQARFPCRPLTQTRPLVLAGIAVDFELRSCQAGGLTFALASADLRDPYKTAAALGELAAGMHRGWQTSVAQPKTLAIDGVTPHPAAGHWRFVGTRADGQHAFADVSVFVLGTRVVRATVTGERGDVDAIETFQTGIRIQR